MKLGLTALCLLAGMALAAGCGGSAATTQLDAEGGRPDRASLGLTIDRSDLGSDWTEQRSIPSIACSSAAPFQGARPLRSSSSLEREHTLIQQRVGRFLDENAAERSFATLISDAGTDCLLEAIKVHLEERAGNAAEPMELIRWVRPESGIADGRYRSRVITVAGVTAVYIDIAQMRIGRLVSSLVIVAGFTPIGEDVYEHLLDRIRRRLEAGQR